MISLAAMSVKPEPTDPLGFLDTDAASFSPFSSSASTFSSSSKGKTIATPEFRTPAPQSLSVRPPTSTSNPPVFAGPSHQYDLHKQQTSLPVGGLANSLAAASQPTFPYGAFNGGYRMGSSSGIPDMALNNDFFDFGGSPSHKASMSAVSDVDMEFDAGADSLFSFNDATSGSEFVDPSAIGGRGEDDSPTPVPSKVGQLWPGMHTQQAALKQKEQAKPTDPPAALNSNQKRAASRQVDPMVEKSISRILDQMRHNSASDSKTSPPPANAPHSSRFKKDEEDMDEDERLLASEEGKKLSSKERRQLRNKVSARAFRSRRKGRILQNALNLTPLTF